jgi:hypothetical protein
MGYQVVDVTLDDGRELCGLKVYNCEILDLPKPLSLDPSEISDIDIQQRRMA